MMRSCLQSGLLLGFVCICVLLAIDYVGFEIFDVLGTRNGNLKFQRMSTTATNVSNSADSFIGDAYARDDEVFETHCPDGMQAKVSQTQYSSLFLKDIPILQWLKHASKKEHDRLREYPGAHGWRGISYIDLVDTLSPLNTSANRVMLDDRDQQSKGSSCIQCAVIGNGGILNGSKKGSEIDQHHYVFRVNGAVIKGFEKDVGSRTSFYIFSTNTMRNSMMSYRRAGFLGPPQSEETRYVFIPDQSRDYTLLRAIATGTTVLSGPDRKKKPSAYFGKNLSAKKFKIFHPDFIRYIRNRFLRSRILKGRYRSIYRPTTGAVMLMAAIHTCDQVDAYGFITPDYKNYSDHYYDKRYRRLAFYANHDMKLEMKLWQQLHKAGLINLYMRN